MDFLVQPMTDANTDGCWWLCVCLLGCLCDSLNFCWVEVGCPEKNCLIMLHTQD